MKEDSDTDFIKEQLPGQRITMRYLIEDPTAGWRRFPVAKAMLAYRGGLQLPEMGGRTIRVVLALVILDGRKVRDIYRLEPSDWKFDRDGRVDQEELMRGIQKKLNVEPDHSSAVDAKTIQLSNADVSAIRRSLGLPGLSS